MVVYIIDYLNLNTKKNLYAETYQSKFSFLLTIRHPHQTGLLYANFFFSTSFILFKISCTLLWFSFILLSY